MAGEKLTTIEPGAMGSLHDEVTYWQERAALCDEWAVRASSEHIREKYRLATEGHRRRVDEAFERAGQSLNEQEAKEP